MGVETSHTTFLYDVKPPNYKPAGVLQSVMSRHSATQEDSPERGDLAHRIEEYADGEECTLFPAACDEHALLTRWITAEEGDFVDLVEMR